MTRSEGRPGRKENVLNFSVSFCNWDNISITNNLSENLLLEKNNTLIFNKRNCFAFDSVFGNVFGIQ